METIDCVFQFPYSVLEAEGFPLRGAWNEQHFHNPGPVVLELGCGKGEYTVGLARRFPGKNFIGLDIKGARMWTGARQARDEALGNAAFLRTNIELADRFFAPGEVSEIWITFPDPQMKKARKRLTATNFMELYRRILAPGGIVHLKTDSPFLYAYTMEMARHNNLEVLAATDNLYGPQAMADPALPEGLREIRTYYEQQWLARGLTIKYIALRPGNGTTLEEPHVEIPHDTYRSFSRGVLETGNFQTAAATNQ